MNELIDIVNKEDVVIGKTFYKECHEKGLTHRSSSVFIFKDDSLGEILLTKRNPNVVEHDKFCNVGGHVESGGNYFETARKELQEEIFWEHELPDGIELKELGKIFYNDMPHNYEFDMVYYAIYSGPFFSNPKETKGKLEFHKIEEVADETKKNPNKFTVAFLRQFDKLMEYRGPVDQR